MKRLLLTFATAGCALAGELAVLNTGFRLRIERHETQGDLTRLHTEHGSMDVRTDSIASFEVEEYVAPKPQPPQTAPMPVAAPEPVLTSREIVEQAALRHGLQPEFVLSLASVESAFNPRAVSPKGATGLMQLMPGTAAELGVDPANPAENADGGTRYLKQLLLKYQNSKDPVRMALAAYNAGPGAVDRYRSIPPYRETQQYVEKVVQRYLKQLPPAKP